MESGLDAYIKRPAAIAAGLRLILDEKNQFFATDLVMSTR
jgi:hypothetical protein